MDPRFECAFCGKEVRRLTDTTSVGIDAEIYFKRIDETLCVAHEFCSLECFLAFLKECYAN